MKQVLFATTATAQWRKLTPNVRDRIRAKINAYAETGNGDVKKLKGRDGCRLRVGSYRAIFNEDATTITIIAVGDRKDIYG